MFAYLVHLATLATIYTAATLAYAIPVGYTGFLNLGHVGLLAIGAYLAAVLTIQGFSFWLALAAAALATGLVGFLLALPTRRIKGDYYALMTLGFIFVMNAVLLNWSGLTGGPFGLTGLRRPTEFSDPFAFLILSLVLTVILAAFVHRLVSSPFGRALEAVRDDDLVAESLGKPVARLRIIALTVSAVLVGLVGALLAHFLQFINPSVFWFDNALWMLASLVIGGLASFSGAILGPLLLFALFEPIRFLPLPPGLIGALRLLVFSFLLLAVILLRPKGLLGRAQLE